MQLSCPEYVNSADFRLIIKLAATKIIMNWNRKVEVFGPDRAFREITIDDFQDVDLTTWNRGGIRALPSHNEHGRGIIFSCRDYICTGPDTGPRSSKFSSFIVVYNSQLVKDTDMLRNGFVFIFTSRIRTTEGEEETTIAGTKDSKLLRRCWRDIERVFPFRVQAVHQFIPRGPYVIAFETVRYAIGKRLLHRLKVHDCPINCC